MTDDDTATLAGAFGPHGELIVEAFSASLHREKALLDAALKTGAIYAGLTPDSDLRAEGQTFFDVTRPPTGDPIETLILCLGLAASLVVDAADKHELVGSLLSLAIDVSHAGEADRG